MDVVQHPGEVGSRAVIVVGGERRGSCGLTDAVGRHERCRHRAEVGCAVECPVAGAAVRRIRCDSPARLARDRCRRPGVCRRGDVDVGELDVVDEESGDEGLVGGEGVDLAEESGFGLGPVEGGGQAEDVRVGVLGHGVLHSIELPAPVGAGPLFPWGTRRDGSGCRAAGQVPKAATRERELRVGGAADIRRAVGDDRSRSTAWSFGGLSTAGRSGYRRTVTDASSPAAPFDETEGADDSAVDARRYGSLSEALRDRRIPVENHTLIGRLTDAIGIAAYFERGAYIRADRRDGGPSLTINSGWTNGFVSEDEIVAAAGDVERWPSSRGTGQWGVTHPVHGPGGGGAGVGKHEKRSYGTCDKCFMEFSAQGTCQCDD